MLTIDPPPTPAIDADGLNAIGFHLLSEFEWACSVIGAVPIDVRGPNRTPKLKAYRQAITKWLRVPRFHGTMTFSYPEIATVMRAIDRGVISHSCVVKWVAEFDANPEAVAYYQRIVAADEDRQPNRVRVRSGKGRPPMPDRPPVPTVDRLTRMELCQIQDRFRQSPMKCLQSLSPREFERLLESVEWGVTK